MGRREIDCQIEYNYQFNKLIQEYNGISGDIDRWSDICRIICDIDNIPNILRKEFPDRIIARIDTRSKDVIGIYNRLLENLFDRYKELVKNGPDSCMNALEMLRRLQCTVTMVPDMSRYGIPEVYENIKNNVFNGYVGFANTLSDEIGSKASCCESRMDEFLGLIQNLYNSQRILQTSGDKRYLDAFEYYNGKIREGVSAAQIRLDQCFAAASASKLSGTASYQPFITELSALIENGERLISAFRDFPVKTDDYSGRVYYMKCVLDRACVLENQTQSFDLCCMIEDDIDEQYGQCSKDFFDYAKGLNSETVIGKINSYQQALAKGDYDEFLNFSLIDCAAYIWHFAMTNPFSNFQFEQACDHYRSIFRGVETAEIILATMYSYIRIGETKAINRYLDKLTGSNSSIIRGMNRYSVRIDHYGTKTEKLIKTLEEAGVSDASALLSGNTYQIVNNCDYNTANRVAGVLNSTDFIATTTLDNTASGSDSVTLFATIASGLRWMNAAESEHKVLQFMLDSQMSMQSSLQRRLFQLSNGIENIPKKLDIESTEDRFVVDITTPMWKEKDYKSFFNGLKYEGNKLDHSLAVREETLELVLPKNMQVPSEKQIEEKLRVLFEDNINQTVFLRFISCLALSGAETVNFPAMLVTVTESVQMGVLVSTETIGKNLNIKIYTLYIPTSDDINLQMADVASLFQKQNPIAVKWETNLKKNIKLAYQQLLNNTPYVGPVIIDDGGRLVF